jgi:hypothetical protein
MRRQTLALLLWLVAEHERLGVTCPADKVEGHLLYWPLYFGSLAERGVDCIVACSLPAAFEEVTTPWRHFCAQQYLTVGLELVMSAVLGTLDGKPEGMKQPEVIGHLLRDGFGAFVKRAIGTSCPRPSILLSRLGVGLRHGAPHGGATSSEAPSLVDKLSEASLVDEPCETCGDLLASGILILAVVYKRWRSAAADTTTRWLRVNAANELWLETLLPSLDAWLDPSLEWAVALEDLVGRFVVQQHDTVMYEKGRLESCWLRVDGGRLHFDQELSLQFRGSRIEQAVNMLLDLVLVEKSGEGASELRITKTGRQVLNRAMERVL